MRASREINPWFWVPTLYAAEGLPYVLVITVSVIMYKRLGIPNAQIAFATSLLYLPWVIKPLWGPAVDLIRAKRGVVVTLQLLLCAAIAVLAFSLQWSALSTATLVAFWLIAFASATHDIAADGLYILGISVHQQAAYVGVRSTFYRVAMIAGQGGLVIVAGKLEARWGGSVAPAWSATLGMVAVLFLCLGIYHTFVLPNPMPERVKEGGSAAREFFHILILFFRKKGMPATIAFLLLYRFAEAQLIKLVPPFLLDPRAVGGLGLSTEEVGIVYGSVGVAALILGGLLGGYVVSRHGLRLWLWPMACALHLPDAVFVYLSRTQPTNLSLIGSAIAIEQFGYGFGLTAYALVMIAVSEGEHATAHYALCTGIMALGMLVPGMLSGSLQELMGYNGFFLWILAAAIPGFAVTALIKIDPGFGSKGKEMAVSS